MSQPAGATGDHAATSAAPETSRTPAGDSPQNSAWARDSDTVAMPPGSLPPAATPPPAAWWSKDAINDPWRNPATAPVWIRPAQEPRPEPEEKPKPDSGVLVGKMLLLSLIVALLAGLLGGALSYLVADRNEDPPRRSLGTPANSSELAKRPPRSVAGIVDRVQPAVVTVVITGQEEGNGSGFVITEDGFILTNNHVAAAGEGSQLSVVFSDGTSVPATVEGRDPGSDIAVLKVDSSGLPILPMGDSDSSRVGDPVIAFGAPLGLSGTVTSGIISAIDRPVVTGGDTGQPLEDESYMAAIQSDAAINPGNSGGPLVDGGGNAIGVNTAIATAPGSEGNIGLGFAIPINHARRVAEQLINDGKAKTTVIGAGVDRGYESTAGGARLRDVESGGPAAEAGLRGGDVIIKFNDRVVDDPTALIALIRKEAAGSEITVEYERDGERRKANVRLSERPS